ncbi:MAG: hypothetical protein ABSE63_18890 [Thermoguttaceae bacterium]|jgi:hypothetical protein
MNPKQAWKDFWLFVSQAQSLWKWLFVAAAGSSLLDLILKLGPPWPEREAIAFVTVIIEIFVYMLCYEFYKNRDSDVLDSHLLRGAVGVVLSLLLYFFLSSHFVFHFSDGSTDAAGFIYTDNAKQYIKDHPGTSDWEIVEAKGRDVKAIFVPWTVDTIRTVLLVLWEIVYGCITLAFSVFVALRLKPIKAAIAGSPATP